MCGSIALRAVVGSTLRAGPSGAAGEAAARAPPSVKALACWGPARPAAATSSTTAAGAALGVMRVGLGVMRVGLLLDGRAGVGDGRRWKPCHIRKGQQTAKEYHPSRPNPAAPAAVPARRTPCARTGPKS